jgi:glycine betaine catabolism B
MPDTAAVSSSVLAFVTTIHASLAMLRLHRGTRPSAFVLALPSTAFAVFTWILATPIGLAAGLLTHMAWFSACELRVRRGACAAPDRPQPVTGPVGVSTRPRTAEALPVIAVHDESENIRTFRLGRPPGWDFVPGQFIAVTVQSEGRTHVRCYSISSAPEATGYLEISVRRQGLVSNLLHDTVRPGASLVVKPPAGSFVYPERDARPVVLVAGGVGITPVMSMLRHAVATQPERPITLLYSVREPSDLAFADELSLIGRRHSQVRVVVTVTGPTVHDVFRRGRIDRDLIREVVHDPAGAVFLMCGPTPMLDAVRQALTDIGLDGDQVRSEAFEAAAALGATVPDGSCPSPSGVDARLTLARSGQVVPVRAGETLLEAAENGGADIPSLCRSGVCGTCRTRLVTGRASCSSTSLPESDKAGGFVLPCVSWAESDCEIEA